jgi:hypothetical protein
VASHTYKSSQCRNGPCAEACQKEGCTDGWCHLIQTPVFRCLCRKECWIKTRYNNYRMCCKKGNCVLWIIEDDESIKCCS